MVHARCRRRCGPAAWIIEGSFVGGFWSGSVVAHRRLCVAREGDASLGRKSLNDANDESTTYRCCQVVRCARTPARVNAARNERLCSAQRRAGVVSATALFQVAKARGQRVLKAFAAVTCEREARASCSADSRASEQARRCVRTRSEPAGASVLTFARLSTRCPCGKCGCASDAPAPVCGV